MQMILWIYLLLACGYSSAMAATLEETLAVPVIKPYLCQFIFAAFDEDGNPLDVQFSRAKLKTASLIETESLIYTEVPARAFKTSKGLRALIEDFDYVKQSWSDFEEYKRYFYNRRTPFEEISKRLQTIWVLVDGKEVQCSWDYHVCGDTSQAVSFFQPWGYDIHWANRSGLPFVYKTKTPSVCPPNTCKISETILIEKS